MSTSQITDDIDILVPLITYLGANPFWWARSSPSLAQELSLDAERVAQTFARYPMIFRRSQFIQASNAYSYALQMRYAQRSDGGLDHPPAVSSFPVLTDTQILSLIEFLLKVSTLNASIRTSRLGAMIAVGAAVLSSVAALASALLKNST